MEYNVYVDGSCVTGGKSRPMRGRIGIYCPELQMIVSRSVGVRHTTMTVEWCALVHAMSSLRYVMKPGDSIDFHSDNLSVVYEADQIVVPSEGCRHLWEQFRNDVAMLKSRDVAVNVHWVPREQNRIADKLTKMKMIGRTGK